MTDHLFDSAIARALADDLPAPGEMRLAVDRDKDGIFDPDDVTRVKIDDGRITAIEKTLDDWDAGDTGVMFCTTGLFDGLERAAARNAHGLSNGLRELARKGRARTVDVTGLSWLDVDTPDALREAERRLMRDQGRALRRCQWTDMACSNNWLSNATVRRTSQRTGSGCACRGRR